jgi:alpha-beta hydrolase superfamily lysophospholipase
VLSHAHESAVSNHRSRDDVTEIIVIAVIFNFIEIRRSTTIEVRSNQHCFAIEIKSLTLSTSCRFRSTGSPRLTYSDEMNSRGSGTLPTSNLYFETVVPPSPRGTILVSHGYAEHCGRYREVTEELTKHRWATLAYDVRGHGQSPGQRGYIGRFGDYLQDFEEAKQHARALCVNGPLIALCHSHGALITLRAIVGGSPAFDALVISSPFLGLKVHVNPVKKAVGHLASKVWPTLTLPAPLTVEILTGDKGKQAERAVDKQCFEIATARWFTEAAKAQSEVLSNPSKITLPSLWLIAGSDQLADAAVSQAFARQIANADVQVYPTMQHEVLNETDRATVYERITSFLATRH